MLSNFGELHRKYPARLKGIRSWKVVHCTPHGEGFRIELGHFQLTFYRLQHLCPKQLARGQKGKYHLWNMLERTPTLFWKIDPWVVCLSYLDNRDYSYTSHLLIMVISIWIFLENPHNLKWRKNTSTKISIYQQKNILRVKKCYINVKKNSKGIW